jgi:formylglycine-generating enzyme required for sulfatase activity/tetratricopeptide (TPR) repeat protein
MSDQVRAPDKPPSPTESFDNLQLLDEQNGPARGLSGTPEGVFYLDLHDRTQFKNTLLEGSLFREIGRQALLIAARDELGLATRDRSLRETFPWAETPTEWPWSVVTSVTRDFVATITVFRRTGSGVERLWEQQFQLDPEAPYESLVTLMEQRSREDFARLLRANGLRDVTRPGPDEQPLPDNVSAALQRMNEISQIFAVRRIHAELQTHGNSPERLGALARGYAHLGCLANVYCAPLHKAYMARALLYAERLLAQNPGSSFALCHRAYARALVGLPEAALTDLDQAVAAAATDAAAPPHWVADIEAYCRGDVNTLSQRLAGNSGTALSAFLHYWCQYGRGDDDAWDAAMRGVLLREPDCLRIRFGMALISSLGSKAVARQTLAELPDILRRGLTDIPDLPDDVARLVADDADESPKWFARLVTQLKDAGRPQVDRSEPSLDALGQLLSEVGFLAAWQCLDYEQNWLGVPVDERIPEIAPWAAAHPYERALTARALRGNAWQQAGKEVLERMDRAELEVWSLPVVLRYRSADERRALDHSRAAWEHADWTSHELLMRKTGIGSSSQARQWLAALQRVAAQLPGTRQWRLLVDPEACRPELRQWETDFINDAAMQEALADNYLKFGETDAAERCTRRRIEIAPSFDAWHQMARVADQRGDDAGWLAALEESLTLPVPGLEHAQTRSRIVRYFMDRNDPQRAEPYAEAGAQTYAAWAMYRAAEVQERLGNWDLANRYRHEISTRYVDQALEWYLWCARTGRGDADTAERVGQQYLASLGAETPQNARLPAVLFEWMRGHTDAALQRMRPIAAETTDPFELWMAASLGDSSGDATLRDASLQRIIELSHSGDTFTLPPAAAIAEHVQSQLAAGGEGRLDVDWLDRQIERLPADAPTNMWFFLGQSLMNHGQEDAGREYLRRAAGAPSVSLWSQWLAAQAFHARREELPPRREVEFIPAMEPVNDSQALILPHDQAVLRVRCLEADQRPVTSDVRGTVRVWHPATRNEQQRCETGGFLTDISPDGELLATLSRAQDQVALWRPTDAKPWRTFPKIGAKVFGARLIGARQEQLLRIDALRKSETVPGRVVTLWDVDKATEVWRAELGNVLLRGIQHDPRSGRFTIATRADSATGGITVRSIADGQPVREVSVPRHPIFQIAQSDDGQWLATVSEYGEVILWGLPDLAERARLWHAGTTALALSPEGAYLAVGDSRGQVLLVDVRQGRIVAQSGDHAQGVMDLRFSGDGRQLISGGLDMTARIWDVDRMQASAPQPESDRDRPLLTWTNSIGMTFRPLPAGEFMMGERDRFASTPSYERGGVNRSRPRHRVVLTRGFYMSQFEVTVGQFQQFVDATGHVTEAERNGRGGRHLFAPAGEYRASPELNWKNPGFAQDDAHPVVQVSWNDAQAFCQWLSHKEGRTYRLPYEAEWEYACRAGTSSSWVAGNAPDASHGYANIADQSISELYDFYGVAATHLNDGYAYSARVGSYRPNPGGFYDMHANAMEWCQDIYSATYYGTSPEIDPRGAERGNQRPQRGGSFLHHSDDSRSAHRDAGNPTDADCCVGFRPLLELEAK